MSESNPQETCPNPDEVQPTDAAESCETPDDDISCVCASICDKLKQKLSDVDTKEVFEATMEGVRKRPLLGVLIAATIGYFLGRLSKKFS